MNVNPDENYQLDDNDLPFAVIKVRTENINEKERKRLNFSGNMGTFIMLEHKDGEVWVYLTAQYADYLKISHPDFSSIEFTLPYDLKPKCGYEMTLVNITSVDEDIVKRLEKLENANSIPDNQATSKVGYITVRSTPNGADVLIDNIKVGVTPYLSESLSVGNHKISVNLIGYEPMAKRVDIKHNTEEEVDFVFGNGDATTINNNNETTILRASDKRVNIIFYEKYDEFEESWKLFAIVDGHEYKIELEEIDKPDSYSCIKIKSQEDFDGDGIQDALIEYYPLCGGNAMGCIYFFVRYAGDGFFSLSNIFGDNVWDPESTIIEYWNGQKSVVIFNASGHDSFKERYIFKHGEAIKVESFKKNSIVALKEILSSDFHNGKEDEMIYMSYDLDENGEMDIFECSYWDRWDALVFNIIINGDRIDFHLGVSRLGILSTKTNGVHDLVLGEDHIVKWNGSSYDF